jgi:integrase/recombinase XerD
MTGFVSGLAACIGSLLDLKHAIGLPYQTSERHLRGFDATICATPTSSRSSTGAPVPGETPKRSSRI